MEDYLVNICTDYKKLADAAGVKINLDKNTPTPFLEEDQKKAPARAPNKDGLPVEVTANNKPIRPGVVGTGSHSVTSDANEIQDFNVLGWNASFIETCCKEFGFAMSSPSDEDIDSLDLYKPDASPNNRGKLNHIAASILMRLLYAARYARFDLLRAINKLASFIAYWDEDCDKRLGRLVGYVYSSRKRRLVGWVGDPPKDLAPHT